MGDTDVISFDSCSGTLIYIRKFQFQKIRGGQFFDFTTVKPRTSKWPGLVLVIDRKILKPFLEPSHKTKTMVRSPH